MAELSQQIRNAIAAHRRDMAELTAELVRIPTENPPGRNYRACAELLARRMRQLGLAARLEKITRPKAGSTPGIRQEPRYCVRTAYGSGGPSLYFHGHYDVVPASAASQFQPQRRNGCIFGRGAGDMKGGLASMIYAIRTLMDLKIRLRGRVEIICVPDEETGGALGTSALFESGAARANAIGMLTAEPTGGVIWNASRGAISFGVAVKGKPAHVGLSFRGVNAFEKMLEVARAFQKEKRRISRRKTRFRAAPEAARRSILLLGGRSDGGTNFNVVPAECSFTIDRRINPEESLASEKKRLLETIDRERRKGIDIEVTWIQQGESTGVAETHSFSRNVAAAVQQITRRAPRFEMCPGLLETRFYSARGIPALAYGPGLLSVAHGPNEFVSVRAMEACAAIYALAVTRILGCEKP